MTFNGITQLRQDVRGKEFYESQRYTPDQVTEFRRRQAERSQKREFPGDYVYRYVEEDGFEYGYDFEECGAQKLFRGQHALEFLPYFCYLDYPKIKNSGLRIVRTMSLSAGDSYCNHRFWRGESDGAPWPAPFVKDPD